MTKWAQFKQVVKKTRHYFLNELNFFIHPVTNWLTSLLLIAAGVLFFTTHPLVTLICAAGLIWWWISIYSDGSLESYEHTKRTDFARKNQGPLNVVGMIGFIIGIVAGISFVLRSNKTNISKDNITHKQLQSSLIYRIALDEVEDYISKASQSVEKLYLTRGKYLNVNEVISQQCDELIGQLDSKIVKLKDQRKSLETSKSIIDERFKNIQLYYEAQDEMSTIIKAQKLNGQIDQFLEQNRLLILKSEEDIVSNLQDIQEIALETKATMDAIQEVGVLIK